MFMSHPSETELLAEDSFSDTTSGPANDDYPLYRLSIHTGWQAMTASHTLDVFSPTTHVSDFRSPHIHR